MAHIPGRAVVATPDMAMDLQCADAFLGLRHQIDDLEPGAERIVRILEHGFANDGKAIAVASAAFLRLADPVKRLAFQFVDFFILTARTLHAIRPALLFQILLAGFFSGEAFGEFRQGHRGLGHGILRCWEDYTHKWDRVSSTT